jgi:hypothetical protein
VVIINFFKFFAVFTAAFILAFNALGWLIKKTNLKAKLIEKNNRYKHFKLIFILIFFAFAFSVEYCKTSLNEKYGLHNLGSTILGAILACIYIKFAPFIFVKDITRYG